MEERSKAVCSRTIRLLTDMTLSLFGKPEHKESSGLVCLRFPRQAPLKDLANSDAAVAQFQVADATSGVSLFS